MFGIGVEGLRQLPWLFFEKKPRGVDLHTSLHYRNALESADTECPEAYINLITLKNDCAASSVRAVKILKSIWRRERDSNPRYPLG